MHTQTIPNESYKTGLTASDPNNFQLPEVGSEAEQEIIKKVTDLFSTYTHANLSENLTKVYANELYFRDAFKEFTNSEDLLLYMLEGLKPLDQAEFVFNRVARVGGDFYFDWTMRLDFKKTPPNTWEESIGVSHMRFNSKGEVIFHQDYWDPTDIVYRRIPIAKQLIRFVKGRM